MNNTLMSCNEISLLSEIRKKGKIACEEARKIIRGYHPAKKALIKKGYIRENRGVLYCCK